MKSPFILGPTPTSTTDRELRQDYVPSFPRSSLSPPEQPRSFQRRPPQQLHASFCEESVHSGKKTTAETALAYAKPLQNRSPSRAEITCRTSCLRDRVTFFRLLSRRLLHFDVNIHALISFPRLSPSRNSRDAPPMFKFANFSFSLFFSSLLSFLFGSRGEETMAEKKRVVVVGGGVGGTAVAKKLEQEADVTLIDPKNYYEVPYAGMRCMVEPAFAEHSVILHSKIFNAAHVVESAAASVSGSEVVTAAGDHVPFDFLVIATGSTYSGPGTKAERVQGYEAEAKRIQAASSVLIVGGGPVGVELAGEIATDFPEKKVTVVHSGDRLLQFLGKKASQKTLKWLESKKVEVILNDRIDTEGLAAPNYVTKNGTRITADVHVVCIGKRVGSSWLQSSDLGDLLDGDGRLKVDANMRLEGKSNIFAVGDIANTKEIKQGYLAVKQSAVVVENIKKLTKATAAMSKVPKLVEYKPLTTPLGIVSLGRYEGVAQLPLVTVSGWLPGMLKSKDLFVGKTRLELGVSD